MESVVVLVIVSVAAVYFVVSAIAKAGLGESGSSDRGCRGDCGHCDG